MSIHADTLRRRGPPLRFIVTHYNRLSCRLRFLSFGSHVCAPVRLPQLVSLCEANAVQPALEVLPRSYIIQLEQELSLMPGTLELAPDWVQWIEAPGGNLAVYLLELKAPDPVAPGSLTWLELPSSFGLSAIERELLRLAYEHYVG